MTPLELFFDLVAGMRAIVVRRPRRSPSVATLPQVARHAAVVSQMRVGSSRTDAISVGGRRVVGPRSDLLGRVGNALVLVDGLPDLSGCWRDAELLSDIVSGLAGLFAETSPSVIVGTESRGMLLGPLVAQQLHSGFVEIRKGDPPNERGSFLGVSTPRDHKGRTLTLWMGRGLIREADSVLFVDDWVDVGAQAVGARHLIDAIGATWVGVATIVDESPIRMKRHLNVRALMTGDELLD